MRTSIKTMNATGIRTITHLYLNRISDGTRPAVKSLFEPMTQYKTAAKLLSPKKNFKENPLGPKDRKTVDHMAAES